MRLIDADALKEELKERGLLSAIHSLDNAPTVDPVRRHGKWQFKSVVLNEDNNIDEWQESECSVCGKWHTTPYAYFFKDYKYCPNCGAKMQGGTE